MGTISHPRRAGNQGVAVIALVAILLLAITLIVFYLNRGVIFEQRIAANQMRSTAAQEMAEAGIEWAIGRLNDTRKIDEGCAPNAASATNFRERYFSIATPTANVASHVLPGCKINPASGASSCSCPTPPASGTTVASPGSDSLPGFTVQFSAVAGQSDAMRVISTGCTAQTGVCQPGTRGASDASASVSALIKLVPGLPKMPASPLTCGLSCSVGTTFNVSNQDVATGGLLVNSGTATTVNPGSLRTIPGQPVSGAIAQSDSTLYDRASGDPNCTNSSVFSAFFGLRVEEYQDSPLTRTISCSSANDCGAQLGAAYNAGWRAFYFPSGLALNTSAPFSSLGSPTEGVSLVSPGPFDINGIVSIYGILFSNSPNPDYLGTGSANIYGAMVSCAGFSSNGNGTVSYLGSALSSLRTAASRWARVPGSWTDRCRLALPLPTQASPAPVITCD